MISAHRPGDVADAARIQGKLAAYYRAKGDTARARAAEDRAGEADGLVNAPALGAVPGRGAVPMPNQRHVNAPLPRGGGAVPMYGGVPVPVPARREPETPNYGTVPSPAYKDAIGAAPVPAYVPETASGEDVPPAVPAALPSCKGL